jgi:hypothetical protein
MTWRLFMLEPTVLFRARVNMASATYPLDEITYDGVTFGAAGSIWPGMTLLLGSSAGADDLGRQRVRDNASGSVIPVGRSSQGTRDGELTATDNAWITVLNDHRVWAKIPYIDGGTIYKDSDILPSDNLQYPPPKANGGIGFAGTIDPNTEVITVEFDGTDSFEFDPAVSSALTGVAGYVWEVDDGTITVGTSTSSAITATFPAGFRYVRLTVESDDGKWHTHHIPVFARDPEADACIAFQMVSRTRSFANGQTIQFRVKQDLPRATFPDGTLIMLWDEELETNDPLRNHMLFVGWEQSNDASVRVERTANLRDTVITAVDTLGRLKTLPGFPQLLKALEIADAWTETQYPNVFYYLWYLLHWHSTAFEVSDILLGTQILNNFAFRILGSDAADLYTQVNSLANNVTPDHWLTCNRGNQLMLVVDPLIQHVPDRDAFNRDTLGENDWYELRWTYNRPPRVYKLLSYAIESDSGAMGTARAAMAPGLAEGQGAGYIETSERITQSQTALNNTEGNRYARLNAPYGLFTIVVPYRQLSALNDPAYMGMVRLDLASGNAPHRELAMSNVRGLVHEISESFDYQRTGLVHTATLSWEMETSGPAAVTYVPPVAEE